MPRRSWIWFACASNRSSLPPASSKSSSAPKSAPQRLAGGPYHSHEDGWLVLGPKYGSIDKLTGPYVFSGGWWNREIQREYYYAETRRGDFLWLYYDRIRRRWFLQGAIE